MLKIYLAGPITGLSIQEVFKYYNSAAEELKYRYEVFHPMTGSGKHNLRTEDFKGSYINNPVTTNHAIFERDKWMIKHVDVIFCDLTLGTDRVSIGSMMELAWADMEDKHVVVVIPEGNIHNHAFVLEAASIVFTNTKDAMEYLCNLSSDIL